MGRTLRGSGLGSAVPVHGERMRSGCPARWGLALAAGGRQGQGALTLAAATDCWDELFGEEEFVDEVGGAVELGELAFLFVGAGGHRDDVTDVAEEANFYGQG